MYCAFIFTHSSADWPILSVYGMSEDHQSHHKEEFECVYHISWQSNNVWEIWLKTSQMSLVKLVSIYLLNVEIFQIQILACWWQYNCVYTFMEKTHNAQVMQLQGNLCHTNFLCMQLHHLLPFSHLVFLEPEVTIFGREGGTEQTQLTAVITVI